MKSKNALNAVIEALQEANNNGKSNPAKMEKNTLTEGSVRKLQVGDGAVDILAKIYILMKKQYDDDKKDAELQRDFEAEKERESKRDERRGRGEGEGKARKVKGAGDFSLMDLLKGLLAAGGLAWLFGKGKNPIKDFMIDLVEKIGDWVGGILLETFGDIGQSILDSWNGMLKGFNLPEIDLGKLALPGLNAFEAAAKGISKAASMLEQAAVGLMKKNNIKSDLAAKLPKAVGGEDKLTKLVKSITPLEEASLASRGYKVNSATGRVTKLGKFVSMAETEKALGRTATVKAPKIPTGVTAVKIEKKVADLAVKMQRVADWFISLSKTIQDIPLVGRLTKPYIARMSMLALNTGMNIKADLKTWQAGEMSDQEFKKRVARAVTQACVTLLESEIAAYIGGAIGAFFGTLPALGVVTAPLAAVTAPAGAVIGTIGSAVYGPELAKKLGADDYVEKLLDDYLGPTTTGNSAKPNIPNMPTSGKEKQALDYFIGKGWSQEQAAGIVNNLKAENSTFDPHLQNQSGSNAYGIAQWMPARQKQFEKLYGKPLKGSSFEEQLRFVNHELTSGAYKGVGDKLRATKSASDASKLITKEYEVPAETSEGLNKEADRRASLLNTNSAVLADNNLKAPDFTPPKPSNQPIIVNAPTNNSVTNNNGGGGAGGMVEARARNDDPALLKSQYGFHRTV